jgi:Putative secretion activating protein
MDFDTAADLLLSDRVEGGYSHNSHDPGGETMWGITRKTAILHGYVGDMHLLPKEKAKEIYRKDYWDPLHLDNMPEVLRYPAFDAAVNSGVEVSSEWLQHALKTPPTGEISADDVIAAAKVTNPHAVAAAMVSLRVNFLTGLPTWSMFGRGWMRRVAIILALIGGNAQAGMVLNPAVTQGNIAITICKPGWTKSIRPGVSYTNWVKRHYLENLGIPWGNARRFELDHIVPLELGGHPYAEANLQIQPWQGEDGARAKDKVETWLKRQVCAGRVKLKDAQECIYNHWHECRKELG